MSVGYPGHRLNPGCICATFYLEIGVWRTRCSTYLRSTRIGPCKRSMRRNLRAVDLVVRALPGRSIGNLTLVLQVILALCHLIYQMVDSRGVQGSNGTQCRCVQDASVDDGSPQADPLPFFFAEPLATFFTAFTAGTSCLFWSNDRVT